LNLPVRRTSDFVHQTGTFTAAIGHQWKGRQALLAQYYATGLPFKGSPAEAQVNALEPRSSLYSVTGKWISLSLSRPQYLVPGWTGARHSVVGHRRG
jgi:hypothetical protein